MNKEDITIVIGGDVYPKGKVEPHFISGNASKIFNDILPVFQNADYTVVNLECPLADNETPILKDGAKRWPLQPHFWQMQLFQKL